jgi:8-oxo-dGTP pyrophosphatase MutT (NUDIX family)
MSLPFDPRLIPTLPLETDLTAVRFEVMHPDALRQRFAAPPAWQPDIETDRWVQSEATVPAAVLVPLVLRQSQETGVWLPPQVLLTLRTAHLKKHGGQISFPGGRAEPSDESLTFTALREAQEEVGLHPQRVEVLGQLPTYVTGTGFEVTPVVGLILAHGHEMESLDLQRDPHEVEDAFEVPLDFLMNPAHHRRHVMDMGGKSLSYFSMPWAPQGVASERFIWGATAAMLRNFYRFLSA